MITPADLLAAHDRELRGRAELDDATDVVAIGPVWSGRYGSHGFVSYTDLGGLRGAALDELIQAVIGHFAADPRLDFFEWKTRGHDEPADLPDRLVAAGFATQGPETVMIGDAVVLAEAELPEGFRLRRAGADGDLVGDVAAVARLHTEVFGPQPADRQQRMVATLAAPDTLTQLWLAEADGVLVSTGRLTLVPGTRFGGLFGGATDPRWRSRGVYRALTSARAGAAMARGHDLVYAECTPFSRPILERAGLVAVTTTTPYLWRPAADAG